MKWFPCETWEVESPLDQVELALRLKPRLEASWKHPWRQWRWNWRRLPFLRGTVSFRGFYVWLDAHEGTSAVEIIGRFTSSGEGTTIRIQMRPPLPVILVLAMWMGAVGFICLLIAIFAYRDGQWDALLIPGMMELGGFLLLSLFVGRYYTLAPRAKELLTQLLADVHATPPPLPTRSNR